MMICCRPSSVSLAGNRAGPEELGGRDQRGCMGPCPADKVGWTHTQSSSHPRAAGRGCEPVRVLGWTVPARESSPARKHCPGQTSRESPTPGRVELPVGGSSIRLGYSPKRTAPLLRGVDSAPLGASFLPGRSPGGTSKTRTTLRAVLLLPP